MDIDSACIIDFWSLCARLASLAISHTKVAQLPDKSMTFERLQKLELSLRSSPPSIQQLDWIIQCPNLTFLDWECGRESMSQSMDALATHLSQGSLPRLCGLRSKFFRPSDEQLERILDGMRQVESLDIPRCEFGPLSMTALRSKFPVLKKLTVEAKSSMETSVVPEILASCPQLEQFTMHRVMSRDILLGKPWVCHSMTKLHLDIIIPSGQGRNRHQQHVLERISHLSSLETLTLEHKTRNGNDTHLQLQLGNGLEHLATLKKLRILVLLYFTQEFTTAEVQWMISNWTKLRRIQGSMSRENNRELVKMLRAAGIAYSFPISMPNGGIAWTSLKDPSPSS
ncbi:MAG: hypothetical protein J3Q66DRAFT_352679 [Benniella sp.]|nr:MAG: hypothetical protein J3Q66DRAFT_352679 [Benniella sp.]